MLLKTFLMSANNSSKEDGPPSKATVWFQKPLSQENLESNDNASENRPVNIPMQRWLADTNDNTTSLRMVINAGRQGYGGAQLTSTASTSAGADIAPEKGNK